MIKHYLIFATLLIFGSIGVLSAQNKENQKKVSDTLFLQYDPDQVCALYDTTNYSLALKTNMLYDIILVPNMGVEFYLRNNYTIAANWNYAWWSQKSKFIYYRYYGGDLSFRKYFGKRKMTGHHIGLYGQLFTYDFEFGGKGIMGGHPSKTLWYETNYAVGLEYGYSFFITKGFNLDFSVGFGYWGGKYREYHPSGNSFVWDRTVQIRRFAPTKAEISLVWLIGDYYRKK